MDLQGGGGGLGHDICVFQGESIVVATDIDTKGLKLPTFQNLLIQRQVALLARDVSQAQILVTQCRQNANLHGGEAHQLGLSRACLPLPGKGVFQRAEKVWRGRKGRCIDFEVELGKLGNNQRVAQSFNKWGVLRGGTMVGPNETCFKLKSAGARLSLDFSFLQPIKQQRGFAVEPSLEVGEIGLTKGCLVNFPSHYCSGYCQPVRTLSLEVAASNASVRNIAHQY